MFHAFGSMYPYIGRISLDKTILNITPICTAIFHCHNTHVCHISRGVRSSEVGSYIIHDFTTGPWLQIYQTFSFPVIVMYRAFHENPITHITYRHLSHGSSILYSSNANSDDKLHIILNHVRYSGSR